MFFWFEWHMAGWGNQIVGLLQWVYFSCFFALWLDMGGEWSSELLLTSKAVFWCLFFSFCLVIWGCTITLGMRSFVLDSSGAKTMRFLLHFQDEWDSLWTLSLWCISLRYRSMLHRNWNPEFWRAPCYDPEISIDIFLENLKALRNSFFMTHGWILICCLRPLGTIDSMWHRTFSPEGGPLSKSIECEP